MAGFEGLLTPQSTEGTKSTDGKKSSGETSSAPKSGPSLFDSMLAQAGGKVSTEGGESTEQSTSTQTSKTQTAQGVKGESSTVSAEEVGKTTTTNGSTDTKAKDTGGSLFDKMVSQTTQQATASQGETTQTQNVSNKNVEVTTKEGGKTAQNVSTAQQAKDGTNTKTVSTAAKTYTVSPTVIKEDSNAQGKNPNATEQNSTATGQKVGTKTVTTNSEQTQQVNQKVDQSLGGEKKNTTNSATQNSTSLSTNKVENNSGKTSTETTPTQTKVSTNNQKQVVDGVDNNLAKKSNTTSNTNNSDTAISTLNSKASKTNDGQTVAKTSATVASGETAIKQNQESPQSKVTANSDNTSTLSSNKSVKQTADNSVAANTNQSSLKSHVTNNTTDKQTQQNPNIATQNNNTISSDKPTQDGKASVTASSDAPQEKKSLADQLIAGATATAKKIDNNSSENKGLSTTATKGGEQTTTTALNNTNLTQKDSVLSSSQTDTSQTVQNAQSSSTKTVSDQQNVDNKIETKTTEQNVLDKKLEDKSLDIKSAQKDQYLDKVEQNKVEKLASTATAVSAATTSSGSSNITNEELANQLATIRDGAKGDLATLNSSNTSRNDLQNSNGKKDDLLNQGKKQDNTNLLDKMVKESTESSSKATQSEDGTLGTKDQFVQKDLPLFATAGYLHDQKRRNDIANMMKKYEGVKQAENAKGVSDIKKSAATLELNATETEVVKEAVQKEEARVQNTREGMLKRLAFDNHMDKRLHNNTQQLRNTEAVVAKSATLTDATEEKVVEVAVSSEAAQTIENRIIGARQSLRTMMSDVARQMAQNYRPPLTAFRINLNPSGLGNIAVMIKSEQNNGINISLNMSNVSTHDTLVDNQAALRAALTRNFDNPNASFNLNFGMQQDNNGQSNQNQDGKSDQNSSSSQRAVSANNLNEESTEEVIEQQASYM